MALTKATLIDLNSNELVLDLDADTSITANTDDQIDFRIGGNDILTVTPGVIDLKNDGGTVSKMLFYCESNNAHAQTLIGAPHSEGATNTLTLPGTGGNARLVSTTSTATLTNKTLTSPDINTSIELLARAEARFQDASGGQFVALEAPATVSSSFVLTLPAADGSSGQAIITDGSGALSFTTLSANTPSSADGQALGSASLEWSDLFLADGGTIQFGNDQDVVLTHVADTGLLLSGTNVIQFNDASQNIGAPSATVLDINATDEIELNATLVDVNANLDVGGTVTATGTSVFASLDISGDIDVDGTTNLDVVDIDGAVNMATTALVTGVLTTTATSVFNGGFTANNDCTINNDDNGVNLTLQSTDDDELVGPKLILRRHSGSPTDGDVLGRIEFHGQDDNDQQEDLVKLEAIFTDVSNGSEDAQFNIDTKINGTNRSRIEMLPTEIVFNEDSQDIDFRIEGNGDANAFFLDGEVDRIYLGHNANTNINGLDGRLQISGTDFDKSSATLIRYSADANPPSIGFAKSRNASIAGNTIVQDGDNLGRIRFAGADGGDFANVAGQIDCQVDGTPGVNDMPGRLVFSVGADGSTSATERMRIHSGGVVSIPGGIELGSGLDATAANTLDDYEEGTFTPGTNIGFASVTAEYVKIGSMVHFTIAGTFNAGPGDTSQASSITGLPFTGSPGDQIVNVYVVQHGEQVIGQQGGTGISLLGRDDATPLTRGQIGNKGFQCTGTYHIDL